MDFRIDCYRSGMVQITESVFETMLKTRLTVLENRKMAPVAALTAAIYYAGQWQGALLVECSQEQARAWSGRLMDLTEPSDADARDGLGELTNVLAGNLKPLLPPGVGISIPSVVDGTDYSLRVCGGNLTERIDFADAHGPFRVTLVIVEPNQLFNGVQ